MTDKPSRAPSVSDGRPRTQDDRDRLVHKQLPAARDPYATPVQGTPIIEVIGNHSARAAHASESSIKALEVVRLELKGDVKAISDRVDLVGLGLVGVNSTLTVLVGKHERREQLESAQAVAAVTVDTTEKVTRIGDASHGLRWRRDVVLKVIASGALSAAIAWLATKC